MPGNFVSGCGFANVVEFGCFGEAKEIARSFAQQISQISVPLFEVHTDISKLGVELTSCEGVRASKLRSAAEVRAQPSSCSPLIAIALSRGVSGVNAK
jgi:hypothetical protein